jgi:DNA-binding CsgD family transcriptional regulator
MSVIEQKIPPGLSANELEIYWNHEAEDLKALYSGHSYALLDLPAEIIAQLFTLMGDDTEAMYLFETRGPKNPIDRLYTYCKCRFGGFSFEPDLVNGVAKSECWDCACSGNCILKPLFRGSLDAPNGKLTAREIEVIQALTANNYQIGDTAASQLGICPSTLNKHKHNIFSKVGVTSIQGLAVWASKMNLS